MEEIIIGNTSDLNTYSSVTWRVLRIYDDGRIDLIGSPANRVWFNTSSMAYNNCIFLLNDICKTLYSRDGIEARSVNLEDIEYWLTDDEYNADGTIKTKGGKTERQELLDSNMSSLTINSNKIINKDDNKHTVMYDTSASYYPDVVQYQDGCGIDTFAGNSNGIGESDVYYDGGFDSTKERPLITDYKYTSHKASINGLTLKDTYYKGHFNETHLGEAFDVIYTQGSDWWLATRYIQCYQKYATFGTRFVYGVRDERTVRVSGWYWYSSSGNSNIGNTDRYIRPVVTLGPGCEIKAVDGAENKQTPHQIISY